MDHKQQEAEQTVADSSHQTELPVANKSCLESSTPVKKTDIQRSQHLDASFLSPTPQKTEETLIFKFKREPAELPEKFRLLTRLFDCMITSLRILNLKKQLPTFQNISRSVEKLTGRKLSYENLAQMKFILPEAVQTDKVLLRNNKTLCMEPYLKVSLLFDVVKDHIEDSNYIALSRTFSNRLSKFINSHSEDCDVPEAELPEPFNKKEITISAISPPVEKTLPNVDEADILIPSHLPPSFRRHFSVKKVEEFEKTELLPSPIPDSATKAVADVDEENGFSSSLDLEVANGKTPMKNPLVNVTDKISVETPDLVTPKRSGRIEDRKLEKVMASNVAAKRVLDFMKADVDANVDDVSLEVKTTSASRFSARAEEKDVVTQIGQQTDQSTSNYLSDLVKTIHKVFQSSECVSISKSELVHKIMVKNLMGNNVDIIESEEIEEQVELLVKKIPEWISKKVDPIGDFMFSVNKGLDLKSITEMLA